MRILIVGLGTQGLKRIKNLPNKFDSITLDPYSKLASFKNIKDISDNDYDTGYFVELLLKGLGTAGTSSATSLIRQGIPSYYDDFSGY